MLKASVDRCVAWRRNRGAMNAASFQRPIHRLIQSLMIVTLCCAPRNMAAQAVEKDSDISVIENRYAASVLPSDPAQIDHLRTLAYKYAQSLGPNDRWSDVDYQDQSTATWKTSEHLERTLVMAKMSRLLQNQGKPDTNLDAKIIGALRAWTEGDFHNPNWWWNQIGAPQLTGEIALLMRPKLSSPELAAVEAILARSDWQKGPWTGANLTWGVEIQIVRGCLENNAKTVAEGYERMYQEIKIVSPTEEGIEQDDSFHQHGAQLYNGGYGLFYANDVGRYVAPAWGTRFQIPADRMAIFSSYLLDGEQWMVRGNTFDYSASGRVITRRGFVAAPEDWTLGPISPAGAAYSLNNTIAMLAAKPTQRQREFQEFAARLQQQSRAQELTGNKQFWCSDFMVHRRKAFSTSVKMLSSRTLNGEVVNGEGNKSQHLSDGVNLLYLKGDEYRDIFPVWDWTKLPGTTAIQGTLQTGESNPVGVRGKSAFAGGVSDGTYGMAAMKLSRGKLDATKAWFFFDDSYLCLGAGIKMDGDAEHSVATDVNQTLLRGDVTTNEAAGPLENGAHSFPGRRTVWVHHDDVGYVFPNGGNIELSIGPQEGRWSDIGSGSNEPVSLQVFNLWIDHGYTPSASAYQYLVMPGASVADTNYQAEHPSTVELANNERIQAVWNKRLSIAMIAFYQPGSVQTPLGLFSADHSCLLLLRKTAKGTAISAANPENLALTLHVEVGSQKISIDLPSGNFAGSTVTAIVDSSKANGK